MKDIIKDALKIAFSMIWLGIGCSYMLLIFTLEDPEMRILKIIFLCTCPLWIATTKKISESDFYEMEDYKADDKS